MSKTDADTVEALLENWGRWGRETHSRSVSNLYTILKHLELYSPNLASEESAAFGSASHSVPVYEADAMLVDNALCRINKDQPDANRAREVVVIWYLHPTIRPKAMKRIMNCKEKELYELLRYGKFLTLQQLKIIKPELFDC